MHSGSPKCSEPNTFTCCVGLKPSNAHYYLHDDDEVLAVLESLAACSIPQVVWLDRFGIGQESLRDGWGVSILSLINRNQLCYLIFAGHGSGRACNKSFASHMADEQTSQSTGQGRKRDTERPLKEFKRRV